MEWRSLRKLVLVVHIASSVGWLGAALAYLALAVLAVSGRDGAQTAALLQGMELVGWAVIVPLCVAALVSGVGESWLSPWGLFRHYWVVSKLVLTLVATAVLLLHMPGVSRLARSASQAAAPPVDPQGMLPLIVHAAGGAVVLFLIVAISVFKPWGARGRTPLWRSTGAR